ncbi:MAG: glutamine--fructose-6-phosphate transaminase (isomerizing) [Nanoarchaeota archaeon]|nr:glutamine--fructose-6-phosphate transaminase (isomerizing) [Nanoarchaeota archaeon]
MCGIIGYIGNKNATNIVVEGLKRLEYRGYDSWGIALKNGEIKLIKEVGKISKFSGGQDLEKSNMAIGHTRWATHGGVTKENSHPHTSCDGKIAVVHNGIIENFKELKKELETNHKFKSETDTEVIPHLIEENINLGFEEAVKKAVSRIKGRYAILVMNADSNKLIAIRRGSPLIVGINNDEKFIASDIPAFLNHTKEVMYLDDNEMVVIDCELKFFNLKDGSKINKRRITIDWDASQAEKGDHPYFVIKEIMEQKDTIARAVNQKDKEIIKIANEINKAYGTFFTGCGTAGKVCRIGEYIFSKVANKHINFTVSSEFPNYQHFLTNKTLMIAISQSGETADVMEAVEVAKKKGVKIISLVNVMGSSLQRASDHAFMINAGPEKAVASTKVTTAQIAIITLLAYATAGKLKEGKQLLMNTASQVNDMLNPRYEQHVMKLAEKIKDSNNIYILGRSLNYPLAQEAAIKIMELSYIHAQGFAGGEMKHGPLALIEKNSPVITLVGNDESKEEIISNTMEAKSRGAYIIGISPENNDIFNYWIKVPDAGNASPIVNLIPIQILAYHLAILRGCDPDYCRNLSKSVTVK